MLGRVCYTTIQSLQHEATVDLREYPSLFVHPDNAQLPQDSLRIRKTLADMLLQAQSALQGYRLMIVEGLRPINCKRAISKNTVQNYKKHAPTGLSTSST